MAQDILTLQQQAAQRVERMRRHERELVCPRTPPAPAPPPPKPKPSEPSVDTEQLLLLAVLLLLGQNGADPALLAALLYVAF